MGHCVLSDGSEIISVKFRTVLLSELGFECCETGWHLCGRATFEWCYNKEGGGKNIRKLLCTSYPITTDVREDSQVCCRNPILEALAIAPSAYKNVCRQDLFYDIHVSFYNSM